ncbi:poly-gamma-glutamate hydrolase [Bacillus phage 031MP004]|nr:poly-gamma-glutamate hydrolase [Bacillus phage 031MP003]QFG05547.1 poly-gamma-glutamate hydrolase [Bacillus phage 031MP002]QFG05633.1 poly-gamma-glutamate hydrolase [Bacillus phage 031MP004]
MADTFNNWEELDAVQECGVDFDIYINRRNEDMIVLTPHGGGTEVGASELVLGIAGSELSYYIFESTMPSNNVKNHITSTNYDEPMAVDVVGRHRRALACHGFANEEGETREYTIIGGADQELQERLYSHLAAAGFDVVYADERFDGDDPKNIVNRTSTGMGAQLELSTWQRKAFFAGYDWSKANRGNTTEVFNRYKNAVRAALFLGETDVTE